MALGAIGCCSVLRCRSSSRSGRPRPVSYLGIVALLSCWRCLDPFFSQPKDGGAGRGRGSGGAGSDDGVDAEDPIPAPPPAAAHPPLPPNSRPAPATASSIRPGGGGQGADGEDAARNQLVLDVKDDDLQCPSSFNSASSMGLISGIRNEGSHFADNYETRDLRNRLPRDASEGANSQVGDKRIHSNDSKNDDHEQLKLHLTELLHFLPLLNTHLTNILAQLEICMATNQDSSTAPGVTDATENNDAMSRMKGLAGSMCSIADKLPVFCGTIFLWLLSNSHASNSPEAGQDFKNPWMQVLIIGNLILCFISFILMALASKLKESESVDVVLCKIFMWLRLPVFLTLWPGLCMILHFVAHTPVFVLWPLGVLFSTLSLAFWYWVWYKDLQKILKELKEGGVLEKDILLEKPE